ncbi:hypothetical protein [Nocardioides jiangxiensis]|uniref:Uncharacterized protein n=1 Tax=Nocardioides jiangxiensis TaxID=3064524 RepID=A0ABT9B3Z8_9ACTN|nr:hypothetical protein [Nocardioides sp. WY-20]MDO7869438.1 hypothetical protein [Nocardioides sp. WY-20]
MNPAQARAAAVKQLKARGAKARKGQLRLEAGDLFWYVDPRLSGGTLVIETGCWLPSLGAEPEGGAVDCPLLFDWPAPDPAVDADLLVDLVAGIDSLDVLAARLADLPGVLVDKALKELL